MFVRGAKATLAALMLFAIASAWKMGFPDYAPQEQEDPEWELAVIRPLEIAIDDALAEMGLGKAQLLEWRDRNPGTALRRLWIMSPEDQRDVARIARFVRIQNRTISAETAWVEAAALVHYSDKYGAPLDLAVAVANTESHFHPGSLSGYGAMGVMQVVWRIHEGLLRANGIESSEDLFNPDRGIAAGCLLLSRYLRAAGDTKSALTRYSGDQLDTYWNKVTRNLTLFRTVAVNEL